MKTVWTTVLGAVIAAPIVLSILPFSEDCFFWIVFWDAMAIFPVCIFAGRAWRSS